MRVYEVLTDTAASLVEAARAAQPSSLEMATAVGCTIKCFQKVPAQARALHVVPAQHSVIHLSRCFTFEASMCPCRWSTRTCAHPLVTPGHLTVRL